MCVAGQSNRILFCHCVQWFPRLCFVVPIYQDIVGRSLVFWVVALQGSLMVQYPCIGEKILLPRLLCSKRLSYQIAEFIVGENLFKFSISQGKEELNLLVILSVSVHDLSHHFCPDKLIVNRSQYCHPKELIQGKHG